MELMAGWCSEASRQVSSVSINNTWILREEPRRDKWRCLVITSFGLASSKMLFSRLSGDSIAKGMNAPPALSAPMEDVT